MQVALVQRLGSNAAFTLRMSHASTYEAGCTTFGLMIFTITTLAIFRRFGARNVETHPILGIVQLASIGGFSSAIGAISFVLVPIAALVLLRVVRGWERLLVGRTPLWPRCGGPLRSSRARSTSSLMVKVKSEKRSLWDMKDRSNC